MCSKHANAGVCHRVGCSVTLKNPFSKFCSSACRQAAYRKGSTHTTRLEVLRTARKLRRAEWSSRRYRDSYANAGNTAGNWNLEMGKEGPLPRQTAGPIPAGVPRRASHLDLEPFIRQAQAVAHA